MVAIKRKSTTTRSGGNKRILFDSSNISPPITPEKQRTGTFDIKPDDPAVKQLFPSSASSSSTQLPLTPPTTPKKPKSSVYSQVKAIFQRGYRDKSVNETGYLVGREEEGQDINEFLHNNITRNTCDSIYLTGPPGSGKSEQLELSMSYNQQLFHEKHCKVININCMVLMNPQHIFKQILMELSTNKDVTYKSSNNDLYKALKDGIPGIRHAVIILDEIDSLLTKNQEVLISLFKLANKGLSESFSTKCLLVGISNSLDLTNTLLPKLSKYDINPQLVNFRPYTFEKMKSIVVSKLKRFLDANKENLPPIGTADKDGGANKETIPIVNMAAILLCCKKTASTTGDLRKCFDIIYKGIELIEFEHRQSTQAYDIITAPKVSISHIAKVCNINYGNSILSKLTYLQQLILVYLINMENQDNDPSKPLTVNRFYDYWIKNQQQGIPVIRKSEFLELLPNMESLSVIMLSTQKNLRIISSNVNYQEFKKSLDNPRLKALLTV